MTFCPSGVHVWRQPARAEWCASVTARRCRRCGWGEVWTGSRDGWQPMAGHCNTEHVRAGIVRLYA